MDLLSLLTRPSSRLLDVVAHPDDESAGLGGLLSRRATRRAAPARFVVVTDGAPRDPSLRCPEFADAARERYAEHRRGELARALAHVAVHEGDVDHLGLVDQEAALHLEALARAVARIVVAHAPDVIVTHAYEGGHPDHDACGFAVRHALRLLERAGHRSFASLFEMASYHADDAGALVVQQFRDGAEASRVALAPDEVRVKGAMMAEHASQAAVLAPFRADRESVRLARTVDFTRPPQEGPCHYERLGWELTSARFVDLAAEATRALGRVSSRWTSSPNEPKATPRAKRTVVLVPYSLATVGTETSGGAEQVLSAIDEALVDAGHRSIVLAPEGSRVRGELVTTGRLETLFDDEAREAGRVRTREVLARVLASERVDVVHFHGIDFAGLLPPEEERTPPMLATLHLDGSAYAPAIFRSSRRDLWLHPVSHAQARTLPRCSALLPPIPNGVATAELTPSSEPEDYALVLGRVCWDKGIDAAIDAAVAAGLRVVVAGPVQPYPDHLAYFERHVAPRQAEGACEWVGPVSGHAKANLVGRAAVLVVASRASETSSLVAMEAIASGTPVAAVRVGALPEIVDDGVTGVLAADARDLPAAIARARTLDRARCRAVGLGRFDRGTMLTRYLALHERLAAATERPRRTLLEGAANA